MAVSSSARVLLTPAGTVVGRSFEQFASDPPSGAMPLLLQGQLTGYGVTRQLTGRGAVRVWVRRAECHIPPKYALGVLSEVQGGGSGVATSGTSWARACRARRDRSEPDR